MCLILQLACLGAKYCLMLVFIKYKKLFDCSGYNMHNEGINSVEDLCVHVLQINKSTLSPAPWKMIIFLMCNVQMCNTNQDSK